MFMKKGENATKKKYNVKEHSVIIIILNCYAGNYFSNFNLLKKKSFFWYFVFETMVITKINEKLLLGFGWPSKQKDRRQRQIRQAKNDAKVYYFMDV